eukprot:6137619-Lingulodinium_polyedra.AAC.1
MPLATARGEAKARNWRNLAHFCPAAIGDRLGSRPPARPTSCWRRAGSTAPPTASASAASSSSAALN